MSEIPINLIFEDSLSGAVLCKLLNNSKQNYIIGIKHRSTGFGWIKKKINGFNKAAKGMPYLILTDLDNSECPPVLLRDWKIINKHHNLLFNIAARQVESWILGCRDNFAQFIGIPKERIPLQVDEIPNAKDCLINLTRNSRRKVLRLDIVPKQGSTAKVGPNYNGRLISFVENFWDPNIAKKLSPSLNRIINVLDTFQPNFD